MEYHFLNSSYREKLIEHLFVGELLKLSWTAKEFSLEISKPEVDYSGYDLVAESRGVIRHIQLKTAFVGSSTSKQNVNISLARKPSGCVVWIYFSDESLKLGPFLFFGGAPAEPLPLLDGMKTARHTKGNAEGFKSERPNLKVIPKNQFKQFDSVEPIFEALFGHKQIL